MENSLTLKEFITESLSEICGAVEDTRKKFSYIAPQVYSHPIDGSATLVSFDIAVTISNSETYDDAQGKKVGGGFRISVLKAEAGIDSKNTETKEESASKVNRIQFNIPVYFRLDEAKFTKKNT